MCESSNPYAASYCKNSEAFTPLRNTEPFVRPHSELLERLGQPSVAEQGIITNACAEAVELARDVQLYRSAKSPYLGLAFIPGTGPNVKVWDH